MAAGSWRGARPSCRCPRAVGCASPRHVEAGRRTRASARSTRWRRGATTGDRPLWLVEGAAGTGKTRLAGEVADRLVAAGWPAGWARPGMGAYAVTAAARNGRRALVLVDDAETRADLFDLLRTVANGGRPLPVRVIMVARDFGPWWQTLLARLTPAEQEAAHRRPHGHGRRRRDRPVAAGRWPCASCAAAPTSGAGRSPRWPPPTRPPRRILLRQAAVVVALSTRVGQLGPAEVRAALRDLFEEEGYWRQTAAEVTIPGQAAAGPALGPGHRGHRRHRRPGRRRDRAAPGAGARRSARPTGWPGSRSGGTACTRQPASRRRPTPRLPAWLADRLPDGTDSTGISWTVAALNAERRATSTLAQLTLDVAPRRLAQPGAGGAGRPRRTAPPPATRCAGRWPRRRRSTRRWPG